jgi:hypothetical protein
MEGRAREGAASPAVGNVVVASDGAVGRIVRLLHTESAVPRYMVVAAGRLRRRYPVIPCALVTRVDAHVGRVHVTGGRLTMRRMSEALPLIL